jgi:hypothetical protein
MHKLTITDHSGDFRETKSLMFRTEEGAKGYAAKKGDFYGMHSYELNGKLHIAGTDASLAEEPVSGVAA